MLYYTDIIKSQKFLSHDSGSNSSENYRPGNTKTKLVQVQTEPEKSTIL